MEIKLSFTKFANKIIYSIVCINKNESILINELQHINQSRQQLVGQISHDLRTPLNVVMIMIRLALEEKDIPEQICSKFLRPALENCDHLLSLINDIVDFTQEEFTSQL